MLSHVGQRSRILVFAETNFEVDSIPGSRLLLFQFVNTVLIAFFFLCSNKSGDSHCTVS